MRNSNQQAFFNRHATTNEIGNQSVQVNSKNSKSQQFVCTAAPQTNAATPVQMTCKAIQAPVPARKVQGQPIQQPVQANQRAIIRNNGNTNQAVRSTNMNQAAIVRNGNSQRVAVKNGETRQQSRLTNCPAPTPSVFIPGGPEKQCDASLYCSLRVESGQLTVPGSTTFYSVCGVVGFNITITTTDGKTITWTATRPGIRVVTVKAGSNATNQNSCYYENNETSDNVPFGAPVNSNRQIPNISHIDFCIDKDLVILYGLVVIKTADTKFNRTYDWDITKQAIPPVSELTLSPGQIWPQKYNVELSNTFTDANWIVYGTITITNTNSGYAPIRIDRVTDLVPPTATVYGPTLSDENPYFLGAGQSVNFDYSVALPDPLYNANSGTNVATVSAAYGSAVADFQARDSWSFNDALINIFNQCVDVTDNLFGYLGQVCTDSAQTSFQYTLDISYPNCGEYVFTNVASFTSLNYDGSPGDDSGEASWTIDVHVPCVDGCTLTQGYWKTHSEKGPAPYDDTWDQLLNGADTPFFYSGKTYYQVLQFAPGGNAYYILAHQFIAAQLNLLNGATMTPQVQAAYDQAYDLFNNPTNTPTYIGSLKGNNALRKLFISLAATLDQYNNGLIGPGHCTE